MYKINWNDLTEERYNSFMEKLRELKDDGKKYYYTDTTDVLGQIRIGEICFDIILITDVPKQECFFCCDYYIHDMGNVETAYGIAKDGKPYEQFNGFDYSLNLDESYNQFVENVNKIITDIIDNEEEIIKEKAMKETLFW